MLDWAIREANQARLDMIEIMRLQKLQHSATEAARDHVVLHRHDATRSTSQAQNKIFVQRLGPARVDHRRVNTFLGQFTRFENLASGGFSDYDGP